MSKQLPDSDTCSCAGCESSTPWDMQAVVLDGTWCCSPACALDHLDTLETPPETVTLHDPQYRVDRDGLPGVSSKAVHIRCDVVGMAEAIEAVRDAGELFPGQFRVARADTEEIDVGE
jgi:hypothetical protein